MVKKVLFKSMVVITGLLLQINLLWAQIPPITLHVETAGTLPSLIAANRKYEITDLTLTGNLNGTDIRFIREMADGGYHGSGINGKLENLNLSGANIVVGGEYYYLDNSNNRYYTSNNNISYAMFMDCNKLKSIILPNSVTSIGDEAFSGCTGLTEIHSKNPIPPSAGADCFGDVNKTTCKLYVPKGSYASYWVAAGWSDFVNIIEEDATAISAINKNNISIYPISNGISIETKEATPVAVYNLSGQKVYQSVVNGNVEIRLDKGVYILRVKNESEKVIVR